MSLKIKIYEKQPCVFVVDVEGSLDSATYQDLEAKVRPFLMATTRGLIFDLKALDYISSMGVSVILKTKKAIEHLGGHFAMVNLLPQIKTVFDIIKALPNMCMFESIQEADNYLSEMQRRAKEDAQDRERRS
jgi:anti-sigma B factor antagonist